MRRVGRPPVQFFRRSREQRAGLGGGRVTHRDDVAEGSVGVDVPGFADRRALSDAVAFERREGTGIDLSGGLAARAEGLVLIAAECIHERFCHHRPAGIARAQHEYGISAHAQQPPAAAAVAASRVASSP